MKRITNSYVKQALQSVAMAEIAVFEALPSCPPITSPQLTKKIERLARAQRRFTWRFVKTAKRRFVTALVALLLLFSLSLSISGVREAVYEFIIKTFGTHTDFEANDQESAHTSHTISAYYKPSWLPEKYVETQCDKTSIRALYVFNSEQNSIRFYQYAGYGGTTLDTESSSFFTVYVNQTPIYVNDKNGMLTAIWSADTYVFQLYCPSEIGLENAVRIIESIESIE